MLILRLRKDSPLKGSPLFIKHDSYYILILVSSVLDSVLLYGGSAITVLIILLPVIEKLEILPFIPFFCSAGAIIFNWFPETDHVPVDVLPGPSVTIYV